jgi:hypothetical protein
MATSAISFEGTFSLNTANTFGTLEFPIVAPDNLAGKLCYAEVQLFQVSWGTTYPSSASDHAFLLRQQGWTMPQSSRIQGSSQSLVGVPIASMTYGGTGRGVPFLFNMPQGGHLVTFTLERLDQGVISAGAGDPDFVIVFNVVPAASRTAPLP